MFYEFAKYLHVLLSIAWLGGGFTMVLLGTMAAQRGEQDNLTQIGRFTETLAKRVFVPSTVAILVLGAYMVWDDWSFAEAWVIIGLVGILLTGAIGGLVLTPLARQLGETAVGPESAAVAGRLLRNARADLVMLAVIVWDMVSKPAWTDVGEIVAMAAVIVLGGLLFLRR